MIVGHDAPRDALLGEAQDVPLGLSIELVDREDAHPLLERLDAAAPLDAPPVFCEGSAQEPEAPALPRLEGRMIEALGRRRDRVNPQCIRYCRSSRCFKTGKHFRSSQPPPFHHLSEAAGSEGNRFIAELAYRLAEKVLHELAVVKRAFPWEPAVLLREEAREEAQGQEESPSSWILWPKGLRGSQGLALRRPKDRRLAGSEG